MSAGGGQTDGARGAKCAEGQVLAPKPLKSLDRLQTRAAGAKTRSALAGAALLEETCVYDKRRPHNVLIRLHKFKDGVLRFTADFPVHFTNLAEQAPRSQPPANVAGISSRP